MLVAPEVVAAAGVANKGQTARVPVRGALAHELRVGRHSGQRVEAEVARGGGVVLEEVVSEGRAVEMVGAVEENILADGGVCGVCRLRVERREVLL